MNQLQEIILPGINAFFCFFSLLFIVRGSKILGYLPIDWGIAAPALLWIGSVYIVYIVTSMELSTLSMLIRGALGILFASPGIAAIIKAREVKQWTG